MVAKRRFQQDIKSVNNERFGIKQAIVSSRFRATTAVSLMVVYAVLEAVFTLFVNRLFSVISDKGGMWSEIAAPLAILLSFWLFQIILQLVAGLVRNQLEIRYTKHILNRIFIHLSEIEQAVIDNFNTGEVIARTVEDTKIASKMFIRPLVRIASAVVTFVASFVVLATIAWQPTLILAGISILIAAITIYSTRRMAALGKITREQSSKLWGNFFEAFKNIKFIKVNNLQEDYRAMVKKNAGMYQEREYAANRFFSWMYTLQQFLFLCSWGATLGVAIYYNTVGVMSIAGVVAFVLSGGQLRSPLVEVSDEIQSIREINVSFARLNKLMEFKTAVLTPKIVKLSKPDLAFENVTFSYDGKRFLLENSTFKIPYGKTYAIVGKTGVGKSTLFDILTGSYPVHSGKVLIGDVELSKDTAYSIRDAISISFQVPFLLNDTIEKNVKILNPAISDDELDKIIRVSQVDQIINKLPLGILSKIGENGVQLSGGERKRIQVAQSLVKNAQIYMFDELTASLDQRTARIMMASIREHLQQKTVIFIEHRLNMIEDVDAIYEFKNRTIGTVELHRIADR